MGKRERVAELLDRAGVFEMVLRVRQRTRTPMLTVLCYHSIGAPEAGYLFDPEVVDATVKEFRAQLELMSQYFAVIGMSELCDGLNNGELPPNPLLITFDDGYRSCVDRALPILKELGLPATFFIATEYVSNRRLYWWDKIHYIIKTSHEARLCLQYPRRIECDLRDRKGVVARLLRLVKQEYALDLERFLYGLAAAANVQWSRDLETEFADELIMTWDDVRALSGAGMEIGSHTRMHRVLQTLSADCLDEELAGSRADIAAELGAPPRAIAYPVGYGIGSEPEIGRAVKRAGYELGFTCESGLNWLWRGMDRFGIRRLMMARELPMSMVRSFLAVPL